MSKRLAGFQKSLDAGKRKEVGLATVKQDWEASYCSCGWVFMHARAKVREDAIDRHLKKRHNGRGIRL